MKTNKTSVLSNVDRTPTGVPHLMVKARAGTGKTTTMVEGLKALKGLKPSITPSVQQAAVWEQLRLSSSSSSVCMCAFNKSIATELEQKVPPGTEAATLHRLGNRAVTSAFGRLDLDGDQPLKIAARIMGYEFDMLKRNWSEWQLARQVGTLVGHVKMRLLDLDVAQGKSTWEEGLQAIVDHFDLELEEAHRDRIFELVPQVISQSLHPERDRRMDYDDMIWLPLALALPVRRYDVLIVDEAQDLNRCQQELARRLGRRLIFVGDDRQAIYGFAGADSESMPYLKRTLAESLACEELPLTVTRRCSKAVVREAQKYVEDFEAHEDNSEGQVLYLERGKYVDEVKPGDMVVCRANAPLVTECFRLLSRDIPATIQGRKIGEGLTRLVKSLNATSIPDLVEKLESWLERERAKEVAKKRPSDVKLTNLQDKHDCLIAFTENQETVDGILNKIDRLFTDSRSKSEVVLLSSIHKAKGLESKRVFLIKVPAFKRATRRGRPAPKQKGWQSQQEDNLMYVAITRAIDTLYYVA